MSLPTINEIVPPSSPLLPSVLSYIREHTSLATVNHSIRPVYFMSLFAKKFPPITGAISAGVINLETAMLALLMHDLGWATTKSLLSKDKRFEIDSAELAVKFIQEQIKQDEALAKKSEDWNQYRLETLWNAIALHTTPSIALHHPNPTVLLVQLAITADFFGPYLPPTLPPNLLTVDEYKSIVKEFPRAGFKEDMISIMCGLCREKPETTLDNFVSEFGRKYGLDGKGEGKEGFSEMCDGYSLQAMLIGGVDACAELEKDC